MYFSPVLVLKGRRTKPSESNQMQTASSFCHTRPSLITDACRPNSGQRDIIPLTVALIRKDMTVRVTETVSNAQE